MLFLTAVPPLPPVSGERIRNLALMRGLVEYGWRVSLFSASLGRTDESGRRGLAALCESVVIADGLDLSRASASRLARSILLRRPAQPATAFHRRGADRLAVHLEEVSYDIVMLSQLHMQGYVPADAWPRTVFDSHNAEALKLARMSAAAPYTARGIAARMQLQTVRDLESEVASRAALVLAVSDLDAGYFARASGGRIAVVPNGVDLRAWPRRVELTSEPRILLMGSLNYSANVDAVRRFIGTVVPHLATRDASVTILGVDPPASVHAAARRSLIRAAVTGFVESARPYLEASRILAVPLRFGGGGTRLKILEALAAGVPVVSTSVGCEGLGFGHERELLIADDPREFASCVDRLLESDALCERLARAGRTAVEQRYDWRAITRTLDRELRGLGAVGEPTQAGAD